MASILTKSAEAAGLKACKAQLAGPLSDSDRIKSKSIPALPSQGSGGRGKLFAGFSYSHALFVANYQKCFAPAGVLVRGG